MEVLFNSVQIQNRVCFDFMQQDLNLLIVFFKLFIFLKLDLGKMVYVLWWFFIQVLLVWYLVDVGFDIWILEVWGVGLSK